MEFVDLDKRQTAAILALAALGCLILVIGIAVVVKTNYATPPRPIPPPANCLPAQPPQPRRYSHRPGCWCCSRWPRGCAAGIRCHVTSSSTPRDPL
jgi:hypothetical protein